MVEATSPPHFVIDGPCLITSFLREIDLSSSYDSPTPSQIREAYKQWLISRLQRRYAHTQQFQCPFGSCDCTYGDFSSAFRHSSGCELWRCHRDSCTACDEFASLDRTQETPEQPVFNPSVNPQSNPGDLTHIGSQFDSQFTDTERPLQTDLPESACEPTGGPSIVVSTSSYESKQANTTAAPYLSLGSSSEYNFASSRYPVPIQPRSVKSDTCFNRDEKNFHLGFARPQRISVNEQSQSVPNDRAEDIIVHLCSTVRESHFRLLHVIYTSRVALHDMAADSISNVLERSLIALKKFCERHPPSDFGDMYSFMHLVLASAALSPDRNSYNWNALKESCVRLGYNIRDEDERAIYQSTLKRIWETQRIPSTTFAPELYDLAERGSKKTVKSHFQGFPPSIGIGVEEKAVTEAKRMLDNLDSTYISKYALRPAWPTWNKHRSLINGRLIVDQGRSFDNAQLITKGVFEPLRRVLEKDDINIYDVQKWLEEGWLLNPREAEIVLVSRVTNAMTQSSSRKDEVVQYIATLFDETMANLRWRDKYYSMSIDRMLANVFQLNICQQKSWKGTEPYPDLLSSLYSKPSISTIDSSLASGLLSSTRRVRHRRSLASPISTSGTSVSHFEAPMEELLAERKDFDKCSHCEQEFKRGQDQKRNFRRHFKTHFQEPVLFECPVEDCDRTYTSQFNCDRHFGQKHSRSIGLLDHLSPENAIEGGSRTQVQGRSRSQSH